MAACTAHRWYAGHRKSAGFIFCASRGSSGFGAFRSSGGREHRDACTCFTVGNSTLRLMVSGELRCEKARARRLMLSPRYDACVAPRDEAGLDCATRMHVPPYRRQCKEAWALRLTSAKHCTTRIMSRSSCRDMAIVRRALGWAELQGPRTRSPSTLQLQQTEQYRQEQNGKPQEAQRRVQSNDSQCIYSTEAAVRQTLRSRAGTSVLVMTMLPQDRLKNTTTKHHPGRTSVEVLLYFQM
jgi:hypothetical protein